jgi:hypothetical protein
MAIYMKGYTYIGVACIGLAGAKAVSPSSSLLHTTVHTIAIIEE